MAEVSAIVVALATVGVEANTVAVAAILSLVRAQASDRESGLPPLAERLFREVFGDEGALL